MICPPWLQLRFRAQQWSAELSVLPDASHHRERNVLHQRLQAVLAYERAVDKLAKFSFNARNCGEGFELVLEVYWLAKVLDEPSALRAYYSAFLNAAALVLREAPVHKQLEAFEDVITAADAAQIPKQCVDQLRHMHWALRRLARVAERWHALDAQHEAVVSDLKRFDTLSEAEQRAVEDGADRVIRARRRHMQKMQRVQHGMTGGPLRVLPLRRSPARVRRSARRAYRRVACRRRQTDSGGEDGPGEPPRPPTSSLVEACGVATVRPGRPRDQASTARFGERARDLLDTVATCGRGPYPEVARVALRPRSAASEAPLKRGAGPRSGRRGA